MRYAHSSVSVGDVTIDAGELVLIQKLRANQDRRVYADSDRFDITRTYNPHLTFGYGSRYCPGAALARIEMQELFAALPSTCPDCVWRSRSRSCVDVRPG